jgi:hypothetical protein
VIDFYNGFLLALNISLNVFCLPINLDLFLRYVFVKSYYEKDNILLYVYLSISDDLNVIYGESTKSYFYFKSAICCFFFNCFNFINFYFPVL